MKNVQRYGIIPDMVYGHDKFGPVTSHTEPGYFVAEHEFDRVTAEVVSANADKEAYAQNAIDLRKRVDALQEELAGERRRIGACINQIEEQQQRLSAADEELDQCQSMARMIEEKEWAEHVGAGPISSQVESAFTQLHNELSEARQGLTAADERADVLERLLRRVIDSGQLLSFSSVGEALEDDIEAALKPAEHAKDEHVCTGCGNKGWTANCKECVPY